VGNRAHMIDREVERHGMCYANSTGGMCTKRGVLERRLGKCRLYATWKRLLDDRAMAATEELFCGTRGVPLGRVCRTKVVRELFSNMDGGRKDGLVVAEVTPLDAVGEREWVVPWTDVVLAIKEDSDAVEPSMGAVTAVLLALEKKQFPDGSVPSGCVEKWPEVFACGEETSYVHPLVKEGPGVAVVGEVKGVSSGSFAWNDYVVGTGAPALGVGDPLQYRWVVVFVYSIAGSNSAYLEARVVLSTLPSSEAAQAASED
jgi:hypothetical protein